VRVAIFGHSFSEPHRQDLIDLFAALEEHNIRGHVETNFYDSITEHLQLSDQFEPFEELSEIQEQKITALLSLGGDGTILKAATIVRDSGIPIMGINLGRLGFLSSIESKMMRTAVQLLKNGMYTYDYRTLIYLESNQPLFGDTRFALNDFTITKRDSSSMIIVKAFLNGEFLNRYWVDGIIVATPTGSTGYSLSCGGPIVFPNSGNFVITPVAAHNLNVRPIVISDNAVISFEVEGRGENFLCTLDSRYEVITQAHQIAVRKCDFTIALIKLHDFTFLKTIRNKLNWGIDIRN
jgi:NAD+ kinase